MRRLFVISLLLGSVGAACASTPGPEPQPEPQPAPADEARDCQALLGVIDAGNVVVSQVAQNAQLQQQDVLAETAQALEVAASEVEATALASEDLLRLGGFYVGVLRLQARTSRDLNAAIAAGDEARTAKLQSDFAAVEEQEAVVLRSIHERCGAAR